MNNQQPYKRKHFFINKRLQGKFTVYFLVLGLLMTIGASVLIWYLSMEKFEDFAIKTHLSATSPWKVIFPVLIKALGVSAVLLVVSTIILTHLIFRRLSTKLKSFDNVLLEIGKGNLNVTSPQNDMDELNEPLRLFIEKMKADIVSMKGFYEDMRKLTNKADGHETIGKNLGELNSSFKNRLSALEIKTD